MTAIDFAVEARRAARRRYARTARDRALVESIRLNGPPQPPRAIRQCRSCPFATRARCDEWMARRG